jgi:hypothetical protein
VDDSVNFLNKSFRKKNRGHVVNRNGGKDRFDVGDPASMIKLIGFDSSELGSKLVNDESISLIPIFVVEDHWVAKVHLKYICPRCGFWCIDDIQIRD